MTTVTAATPPLPGSPHPAGERAQAAADAAAARAGVVVREIADIHEVEAVARLYQAIWRSDAIPPIAPELLRALALAGNYVGAAFAGGELVGACVGFFSAPAEGKVHSHIAGVSAAVRGRDVGFALKLHQRAWALGCGVSTIAWTFDPLVSRNAWFNLAKLAAEPVDYLPNFYGGMHDSVNGADDSDRLLVHWALSSARVAAAGERHGRPGDAAAERAGGAVVALAASPLGRPVAGALDGDTSLVAVPADIESLRATDPGLAKEWRTAVREVLVPLMSGGARISGFDRAGWYIVRRPQRHEAAFAPEVADRPATTPERVAPR